MLSCLTHLIRRRIILIKLEYELQLGPVYTERQRQRCDHSAMMLAILFSLQTMETLENGFQILSEASSQSCRSVEADVWCKRTITLGCIIISTAMTLDGTDGAGIVALTHM